MKRKIILVVLVLAFVAYFFLLPKSAGKPGEIFKEITPVYADIQKSVSATGIVQPLNRLEMKPPVAGRIDQILVQEGQEIKIGDTVALMSSTERAALLDAARSKSKEEVSYWEGIYKAIPLIAPIDGKVIVSTMQPGQTITQADPVVVLSNKLIVQAQVDETDIGRVREGQSAVITLDAYPDIEAAGVVGHIYNESKTVNNVNIYQVDVMPKEVPAVFRSGMSANVNIVEESKEHVLTVPLEAVKREKESSFVWVKKEKGLKPEMREIKLGVSDDSKVEVVSGLDENDTVLIATKKYTPPKSSSSTSNPFMPGGSRRNSERRTS